MDSRLHGNKQDLFLRSFLAWLWISRSGSKPLGIPAYCGSWLSSTTDADHAFSSLAKALVRELSDRRTGEGGFSHFRVQAEIWTWLSVKGITNFRAELVGRRKDCIIPSEQSLPQLYVQTPSKNQSQLPNLTLSYVQQWSQKSDRWKKPPRPHPWRYRSHRKGLSQTSTRDEIAKIYLFGELRRTHCKVAQLIANGSTIRKPQKL